MARQDNNRHSEPTPDPTTRKTTAQKPGHFGLAIARPHNVIQVAGILFAVTATVALFLTNLETIQRYLFGEGELSLVEVEFVERPNQGFTILDLKLRNTGEIAFLTEATFRVTDSWRPHSGLCTSSEPASWTYDMVLPEIDPPFSETIDLSQSIKQGEVDRFRIEINTKGRAVRGVLNLTYNETRNVLSTRELIFFSPVAEIIYAAVRCGKLSTHVLNRKSAEEMTTGTATNSPWISDFIDSYTQSPVPEIMKEYRSDPAFRPRAIRLLRLLQGIEPTAQAALANLEPYRQKNDEIDEAFNTDVVSDLIKPLKTEWDAGEQGLTRDQYLEYAIYLLTPLAKTNDAAKSALDVIQSTD